MFKQEILWVNEVLSEKVNSEVVDKLLELVPTNKVMYVDKNDNSMSLITCKLISKTLKISLPMAMSDIQGYTDLMLDKFPKMKDLKILIMGTKKEDYLVEHITSNYPEYPYVVINA